MMQQGADIRAIQQLLGHVSLKSTTVYTRVMPLDVKATHRQYHPHECQDKPKAIDHEAR